MLNKEIKAVVITADGVFLPNDALQAELDAIAADFPDGIPKCEDEDDGE